MNVVVFGSTGPIGSSLVNLLSNNHPDWTIMAATRSPDLEKSRLQHFPSLSNVKMVQCDAFNRESVLSVSKGCDIMYSCIGFVRYERKYWAEHWPIVVKNLLSAVIMNESKTKKLVFCDNIYSYGSGINISPKTTTPVNASTGSKRAIRSMIRQMFENHMKEHPGTVSVVGGSDCFGPNYRGTSWLGDTVTLKIVEAALKGRKSSSVMVLGSCDVVHDFCYVHDFAKALAIASVNEKAYDNFWICPHAIHNKTQKEIANDIAKIAYKNVSNNKQLEHLDPVVSITALNKWKLVLLSIFIPVLYEMIEMLDSFTKDYTVDDHDFCSEFQIQPTNYEDALESYVKFYMDAVKK
jgi:nucleoside-diphosphate-sugar epimerase